MKRAIKNFFSPEVNPPKQAVNPPNEPAIPGPQKVVFVNCSQTLGIPRLVSAYVNPINAAHRGLGMDFLIKNIHQDGHAIPFYLYDSFIFNNKISGLDAVRLKGTHTLVFMIDLAQENWENLVETKVEYMGNFIDRTSVFLIGLTNGDASVEQQEQFQAYLNNSAKKWALNESAIVSTDNPARISAVLDSVLTATLSPDAIEYIQQPPKSSMSI